MGQGVNVGGARRKEKVESGMKLIYKFINKNQLCTQIIYEEKNFKIFLISILGERTANEDA